MNTMRRLLCIFTAVVLAAFALQSFAASTTKTFYAVFPQFIPGGNNVQITATFYNNTPPPGISTINSIRIVPPTGVTFVPPYGAPGSPSLQSDGSLIINNIPGIKTGKSLAFTLYLNVSGSCANGTWGAFANTGNAYPGGDNFQPVAALMQLSSACDGTLACNTVGTPFAFGDTSVEGIRGAFNKDGSLCIAVAYNFTNYMGTDTSSLGFGPNTVHLQWDTGSQPYAAFSYSVNWTPVPLTSAENGWPAKQPKVAWLESPPGTPIFVPALACVGENYPVPYGTLTSTITSTDTSIGLTATGTPPPPSTTIIVGTEHMLVTSFVGSFPSFTLTVVRGQDGTLPSTPSAGTAVTSLPQALPEPIGNLTADITTTTATTITVNATATLPPVPFPAVINTERILVTVVSGSSWTVKRGQANLGADAATHSSGAYVMSTPLPIIPLTASTTDFPSPYVLGTQARMCVSENGFATVGIDPATGNTLIQYFTTIIDEGDGWGTY